VKPRGPELDPETATWLEFRKVERRVPPEIRARVLARSRAIVLGGEVFTPALVPERERSRTVPAPFWRGSGLGRLALAAAIAIVAGTVGAIAALRGRAAHDSPAVLADTRLAVPAAVPDEAFTDPAPEVPTVTIRRAVTTKPDRAPHRADPFAVEAELLQRAHLAYARHDFSVALALVDEHARRFSKGPLAEEREALRVESLVGAGFADEARRHAATFVARFPRSVLLPRVEAASRELQ